MTAPDTLPAETITCEMPGCGAAITRAEAVFHEDHPVCRPCDNEPAWMAELFRDFEPPF